MSDLQSFLKENAVVSEEANSRGVIFQNFPSGRDQTNQFEDLTDGINLAIVFEEPHYESADANIQQNQASQNIDASYYEERVNKHNAGPAAQIQDEERRERR